MSARWATWPGPGSSIGVVALAVVALSCMPSNELMPLRGEDPQALALSGERAAFLEKTGATRAFERFHEALVRGRGEECAAWLGPDTMALVTLRARQSKVPVVRLLEGGRVEGLSVVGSDEPLQDLRAPLAVPVVENRPFDPTRTAVTLVVRVQARPEPMEVPAVYTEDGWRIELVRGFGGVRGQAMESTRESPEAGADSEPAEAPTPSEVP